MAIQKSMVYRKKKQGNEYEWSDRSKSMRSAGGTSNTREIRSAIKNTARSFATPMRTPSVARSGYVKKAYSNRTLQTSQGGVSNRVKTAVDKRDYAVPESRVGLRTKAKTIGKYRTTKWGR